MEEKILLVNNQKVNYKIAGTGPVILILHGWGGSSDSWVRVQEILAQQGYKVISPDLPGFGKSEAPFEPWGVIDYANWLNKFVNFLNIKNFFILAHSFGGRVAVKFALNYPERLQGLILCNSAGIKPKPGLKTKIIFLLARIGNTVFSQKYLVKIKKRVTNLFYIFLRHQDYVKAKGVMKETIKKVLAEDLLPCLSQIKVKTLIIWGGADKMVPLKYAFVFKEKITNSELKLLPKVGHSPHLEVPEKLADIIIKFLAEQK
ncbi:alpha/beta hydrolase [bacterium]|nr:alpha/beta hydrolase [bacterium]